MYPGNLQQWWMYLSASFAGVIKAALVVGCLSLWLHRKDLRTAWQKLRPRSLRFNLLSLALDVVVVILPLSYLIWLIQAVLYEHGLVLFHGEPLAQLSLWIVAPLAVFIGDLIAYFRHRFEHSRWLWPSHVMHHSDTDLNWLTVYRFHPINRLSTAVIDSCTLVALGFPPWAVFISSTFRHYYGILVHLNVPWTFGPLGKVLVSPAMHRWHHVREGEGVGSNFASVFSVFDRMFGTLYMPGPCNEPLGVTEVDNNAYFKQLAWPFYRAALAVIPKSSLFAAKPAALEPEEPTAP